jgi:hypothetical protein
MKDAFLMVWNLALKRAMLSEMPDKRSYVNSDPLALDVDDSDPEEMARNETVP